MRNIIITGGGFSNKGAQAMTLITVDELKKRYPDHEIFLLLPDKNSIPKEELDIYNFKTMGWYPIKFARCQSKPLLRAFYYLKNHSELKEAENIYRNSDLMVDISGYALGSNWDYKICSDYLDNFEFAKAFRIPVYLMPQSFGPFEFNDEYADALNMRISSLLSYAKVICARESDGYNALLTHYNLNNVQLSTDLVLNNKEIDLKNVFKTVPEFDLPEISENSVGIIPNSRTIEVGNKQLILNLYKSIIDELLSLGKHVYILSHSSLDAKLCREVKSIIKEDKKVYLIEKDFSCLEFNKIVKQFQFVVASRFHSIVHAFKNGIPCISIGWAVKYNDLMSEFGQQYFAFDVRNGINNNDVIERIDYMNLHMSEESCKIEEHLREIQKHNVFDVLPD